MKNYMVIRFTDEVGYNHRSVYAVGIYGTYTDGSEGDGYSVYILLMRLATY